MKNSVFVLISLLFIIACGEEEEIFPDGRALLPGVYDGVYYDGLGGQDGNATATVKFINKNTYKIYFSGSRPEIEIKLKENDDDSYVYFEVKDWSSCKGNPNKFVIYENVVSPRITLSCCMKYESVWGLGMREFTEKFDGSKPL